MSSYFNGRPSHVAGFGPTWTRLTAGLEIPDAPPECLGGSSPSRAEFRGMQFNL